MSDALKALLKAPDLKETLFPPTSRYAGVEVASLADGRTVTYLRRRFCPPPARFTVVEEHTVVQGDRADNLAARYIGDPEQAWRICDANGAMSPGELTETPGRKLAIALPEGLKGA